MKNKPIDSNDLLLFITQIEALKLHTASYQLYDIAADLKEVEKNLIKKLKNKYTEDMISKIKA